MSNVFAPTQHRTYVTARAIDTFLDVAFIGSGGALAMTLPTADDSYDGHQLTVIATTAQTHTVTVSAGFNGAGGGADVATFGGAIGDNFVVVARQGVWYVVSLRNVTLG